LVGRQEGGGEQTRGEREHGGAVFNRYRIFLRIVEDDLRFTDRAGGLD
jgi:hypothetical protein